MMGANCPRTPITMPAATPAGRPRGGINSVFFFSHENAPTGFTSRTVSQRSHMIPYGPRSPTIGRALPGAAASQMSSRIRAGTVMFRFHPILIVQVWTPVHACFCRTGKQSTVFLVNRGPVPAGFPASFQKIYHSSMGTKC